jgi:nitrogen fixation protein FixH
MVTKPSGQGAIDAASRSNSRLFAVYIVVLIATALVLALFTFLTWRSGNNVQNAIVSDANARIEEAKQKAADANERAGNLEKSNLVLRGQVATLETNAAEANKNLAALQKAAADAKASQQRVEIDLAKQRERAANAEKDLATLKEELKPRHLTIQQRTTLAELLKGEPRANIDVWCIVGDAEGNAFATEIAGALYEAGWSEHPAAGQAAYAGGIPWESDCFCILS